MKKVLSISLSILFSFTMLAQSQSTINNGILQIAKNTDKKCYIINGKITDVAPVKSNQKAWNLVEYLDYYEVEFDGYALGDPNQISRFYGILDDSNYTYIGTAFTHVFDFNTFDFEDFGTKYWQNFDFIDIDSIHFNLGHVNHSGLNNTLAITLRELPIGNAPTTNGSVLWTDTITDTSFTDTLKIFQLPTFSVPVGITLPYIDRGVYLEIYFKGVPGKDSASFLFNAWNTVSMCPITQMAGLNESFTFREDSLIEGRTYFRNPTLAVNNGMPASTYFSNFSLYNDCNSNGIFDHGMGEAMEIQNISQGIWYTAVKLIGIEDFEKSAINIYPNPVIDILNLEFARSTTEMVTLQIVDFQGRIVKENKIKIENAIGQLDVTGLNHGMYVLRIIHDGNTINKKLVID